MGISVWQLLIILAIVLLLFGAKRLRSLGTDLGASVKGFRSAMKEGEAEESDKDEKIDPQTNTNASAASTVQPRAIDGEGVIEGEVVKQKDKA